MVNNALPMFLENKVSLELPLKYPEVYCVTYTPEFPGPLVSTDVVLFCFSSYLFRQLKFDQMVLRLSYGTQEKSVLVNHLQVCIFRLLFLSAYLFSDTLRSRALKNEKTLIFAKPDKVVPEHSGEFDTIVFQGYGLNLYTFQEGMTRVPQNLRVTQRYWRR